MAFPDQEYLHRLADNLERTAKAQMNDLDRIMAFSGVRLQWLGDILSDDGWTWEKQDVPVDSLTLTGTNPTWNKITLKECERSPSKFREWLSTHPDQLHVFDQAQYSPDPILIRMDGEKRKVLEGMHRTVASIRDGRTSLTAFIGTPPVTMKPRCEPHVVYDLLRPHLQRRSTDREGLIAAIRYLRQTYANVDQLLQERFSAEWLLDKNVTAIVNEALE